MATNYDNQRGFYENVKLDENGYLLVTGISAGGGATGPAGTSGTSGSDGTSGTSGVNGSAGESGTSGTSGVSPEGGAAGLVSGTGLYSIQSNTTLTPGATASGDYSISLGGGTASGDNSINIGFNNSDINGGLTKLSNILIGEGIYMTVNNASSFVNNNILIGKGASLRPGPGAINVDNNVVIGSGAYTSGDDGNNGVAIGSGARTGRFGSVAVGLNAQTTPGSNIAVAVGAGAYAQGETAVAIGYNAGAGAYSVNVGYDGSANGFKSIGLMGRASGNYSFAASGGENTQAGGIAIGNGAYSSHANAAVFGATVSSVAANTTHVNRLYIKDAPVYETNMDAISAGLVAGEIYRTASGVLMITY